MARDANMTSIGDGGDDLARGELLPHFVAPEMATLSEARRMRDLLASPEPSKY